MGARQTILPLFFPRGVVSSRYNFSFSIFQLHLYFVSPLLLQFLHFLIRPGQMTPSPAHWTGRNEAPPRTPCQVSQSNSVCNLGKNAICLRTCPSCRVAALSDTLRSLTSGSLSLVTIAKCTQFEFLQFV